MYSLSSDLAGVIGLACLTCGFHHALSRPVELLSRDARPSHQPCD